MDAFEINNLTFKYDEAKEPTLKEVNLRINEGDFVLLCGKSGCGKSTLLRLLKHTLAPIGEREGSICFFAEDINTIGERAANEIGFVMQDVDSQIICDDVYGELCFGMSHLGFDKECMGRRVFEVANYFGINHYLEMDIHELSGGQKQLLAIAGVMTVSPKVLLLDEPTSSLDVNSAELLIGALERLNRELGITVVIAEQNLGRIYPICNRVVLMENGKLVYDGGKKEISGVLPSCEHREAFPIYVKAYNWFEGGDNCPGNMNEGKRWLLSYKSEVSLERHTHKLRKEIIIDAKNLWFRYNKNSKDVLKDITFSLKKGEIACVLGANGSGKSTLLKTLCGIKRCYEGKIKAYSGISMVCQNAIDVFRGFKLKEDFPVTDSYLFGLFELDSLMDRNPYDLSGGELQRAAVVKAMLECKGVLLLDEITKGMGEEFKSRLGEELVRHSKEKGLSVILSSHDIDFCARYTDTCHLLFNGSIVASGNTREIVSDNDYYTTAARILTKDVFEDIITDKDVMELCQLLKIRQ